PAAHAFAIAEIAADLAAVRASVADADLDPGVPEHPRHRLDVLDAGTGEDLAHASVPRRDLPGPAWLDHADHAFLRGAGDQPAAAVVDHPARKPARALGAGAVDRIQQPVV